MVEEVLWNLSVEAVAASMERTAAVMSQCALCMRDRSRDVKDFEDSLTCIIVASKSSGVGTAAIAADRISQIWRMRSSIHFLF